MGIINTTTKTTDPKIQEMIDEYIRKNGVTRPEPKQRGKKKTA
jgi:hypothetical protein